MMQPEMAICEPYQIGERLYRALETKAVMLDV